MHLRGDVENPHGETYPTTSIYPQVDKALARHFQRHMPIRTLPTTFGQQGHEGNIWQIRLPLDILLLKEGIFVSFSFLLSRRHELMMGELWILLRDHAAFIGKLLDSKISVRAMKGSTIWT